MYVYIYIHIYTYYTHPTSSMKSRTLPAHVSTLKKKEAVLVARCPPTSHALVPLQGCLFQKHPEILKSKNSWGKRGSALILGEKKGSSAVPPRCPPVVIHCPSVKAPKCCLFMFVSHAVGQGWSPLFQSRPTMVKPEERKITQHWNVSAMIS